MFDVQSVTFRNDHNNEITYANI